MAKLILKFFDKNDHYSDGEKIENSILKIFKSKNPSSKIKSILDNKPSWPNLYHLSPKRKNLLEWYDFNKNKKLLEIGAGCGALTGLFCKKTKKVTAIELSMKRAEILINRHKDKQNLTVIVGNLNKIKLKEKFDYITLIGVLEYAGLYTKTQNPFLDFLKKIKKILKPGGTIIIAIENKFGLKYWSGAREDHTGKHFDSIENYPNNKKIQTFSKKEIKNLLINAGLTKTKFYYPLPDYKLPSEIFSENYLPNSNHLPLQSNYPFKEYSYDRDFLFNEEMAMKNIINNNQFEFFSNSFLIIAKK